MTAEKMKSDHSKSSYRIKAAATVAVAVALLILCVGCGSVAVSPGDITAIILNKIFGVPLPYGIAESDVSIIWSIRLPR
ncbi:MAG: hypothetical protein J6N76_05275, partial [Lachnospiraceae bacterium]|nr:hypothetical protein [Lachnospiraceae bacterium]